MGLILSIDMAILDTYSHKNSQAKLKTANISAEMCTYLYKSPERHERKQKTYMINQSNTTWIENINNCCSLSLQMTQGSFWAWTQPMGEGVTILSLPEPIPTRMIPDDLALCSTRPKTYTVLTTNLELFSKFIGLWIILGDHPLWYIN